MVASAVLLIGMLYCSVCAWYHVNDLLKSSRTSIDSYIEVVKDGRKIFENTRPFFPRCEKPLRSASGHLGNFAEFCKAISNTFERIPLIKLIKDFPLRWAESCENLKKDMDELADTVHEMYDGKGCDDVRNALNNTETNLRQANRSLVDINRTLHFMVLIVLMVTVILCSGMFFQGLARVRQS